MTDIFAQQGINFQSSGLASTNPTAVPAAIPAPKVNLPPQDASPIVSTAPKGNKGMTQDEQAQAMRDLYGDETNTQPADTVPVQQPVGRDIFGQMGIEAPTVPKINTEAFNTGMPLPPQKDIATNGVDETVSNWKPISRAEMSLPPEMQVAKKAEEKQAQVYAAQDYEQILQAAKGRFGEDKVKGRDRL
jgi:hypothetical protein